MTKTLFKGIQQVTMDTFNAAEEKKGYLWLVREPMFAEDGESADANVLANDRYHIYFGTRCYGIYAHAQCIGHAYVLHIRTYRSRRRTHGENQYERMDARRIHTLYPR